MPGTRSGGLKTNETNKERYGEDYYQRIGQKGGKTSHKVDPVTGKALKGFALNRELAAKAGAVGGKISKRNKDKEQDA